MEERYNEERNIHTFIRIFMVLLLLTVTVQGTCNDNQYACFSEEKCIPEAWVCDGDPDCLYGSDESNCSPYFIQHSSKAKLTGCPIVDDFLCTDSLNCVRRHRVCNGFPDCDDASDEDDCYFGSSTECSSYEFHCIISNECIDARKKCDGVRDCKDQSDETDCIKSQHPLFNYLGRTAIRRRRKCSKDDFICPTTNRCIPNLRVCDGIKDCEDWSDEINCHSSPTSSKHLYCGTNQILCMSGDKCIPVAWVCDGDADCIDESDEQLCYRKFKDSYFAFSSTTSTTHLQLQGTMAHVSMANSTLDGPDHKHLTTTAQPICTDFEFSCTSTGHCIEWHYVCNGAIDCPDASDESNCRKESDSLQNCTMDHYFECSSRDKCIPHLWVCDGDNDCSDGSDEMQCQNKTTTLTSTTLTSTEMPAGTITTTKSSSRTGRRRKCHPEDFTCLDGGSCIHPKRVCDGNLDCTDGSDEINCRPYFTTTLSY